MVQRVISNKTIEHDWESVRESVTNPDDAVIVESDGQPKVVVITFDRYQRTLDLERDREHRLADARRRFEALAASIGDRNSDLTPEIIEEMANRDWDEPDLVETPNGAGPTQVPDS